MILLRKYQEEAVASLLNQTYKLLQKPGARHSLVFKAPTGAGKTVMMAAMLNRLCEELPEKVELPKRKIAFIWIAPNKLYIQSYNAIKDYFSESRSLKAVFFEDISGGSLQPSEILFVNWESINKEKNLMVRDNEGSKTLYSYVNQARLEDIEIVTIIDEEHMFANPRTARRANEVLQNIYPKIEMRVSATPLTNSDYKTVVERQDVIREEMIKEGIVLNPAMDTYEQKADAGLTPMLIDIALEKREQLKQAYKNLGIDYINPLLLIQLPNDDSEVNTVEDQKYIDSVIQYLEVAKGISVNNNRLAIWLSGRKDNLPGIEKPDNMVDVLLFKQAIALGWDCPRAAVLLIFRELHSETFTIQTVGRILRMPEQKHYPDPLLNQGYVYTNLSRDKIQIVRDDMSYITMNRAIRRQDYKPVQLTSSYINTKLVRNRLGIKFKRALFETAEKLWGISKSLNEEGFFEKNKNHLRQRMMNLDVQRIDIVIPENVNLSGEVEVKIVTDTARFAKTQDELNTLFRLFCRSNVGSYAPVDSAPVLEMALKLLFEEYFGLNEYDAVKIILYPDNSPHFVELITKSLERYDQMQQEKAATAKKEVVNYPWEVPVERIYNELYDRKEMPAHALLPFYELIRVSNPEKKLAEYLESKKDFLEWWYKNGESAKEHFAIPYTDYTGKKSLFYVDFVIRLKNGITCLFDTKTPGSDPGNVHLKHNALVEFIEGRNEKGMKTTGGIIIGKEVDNVLTWRFCRNRITDTKDLTGWDFFDPATLN